MTGTGRLRDYQLMVWVPVSFLRVLLGQEVGDFYFVHVQLVMCLQDSQQTNNLCKLSGRSLTDTILVKQ